MYIVYGLSSQPVPTDKNIFDSQVQMQLVDTSFFRAAGATISRLLSQLTGVKNRLKW